MKRFLCFFLGFAMMLGLFGCGKADTSSTTESATQSTQSTTMSKTENTSSKESKYDMYMENLKQSDVFKQYSADDWRSHAYDYKLIALTFDDGPMYSTVEESEVVVRIIQTILQYEGKGTFFFTGRSLEKSGFAVPQYALDNGFEVGNHSYNHSSLSDADYETAVHEIADVNDMYEQNLGIRPKYFRGGGFSQGDEMWKVVGEQGMVAINCVAGFGDHAGGSATVEGMVEKLKNGFADGSILCMHSTNSSGVTPDALAIALPELYEQGYRFCTLSELFAFKGVAFEDVPKDKYIKKAEITQGGRVIFN